MPKLVKDKVDMDIAEMLAVFVNEKFFEGSWDKHIETTEKYGSQIQREEDIPLLETLKKFEKTHNLALFEQLPDDWMEEEIPKWLRERMRAQFHIRK